MLVIERFVDVAPPDDGLTLFQGKGVKALDIFVNFRHELIGVISFDGITDDECGKCQHE